MSFLTAIRLKAAVGIVRLSQGGPPPTSPDSVLQVPSRDTDRTIKVHVYHPKDENSKIPSPVLLNFHGSGFVLPFHGSDELFCRRIAQNTQCTVFDVQYRLAPEHPFPAATNDAEDVVKYVLARPGDYDTSQISLSGFSAGGNIALGVSTIFPPNTIRSVIALYPPTDLSLDPGKKSQPEPGPNVIPAFVARLFNECYFGKQDAKNPLVSPSFADATKFPENVLIVTCAHDTLALEAESLADDIAKSGAKRNVVQKRIPGVSHAWDKTTKPGSEGEKKRDEVYDMCIRMLQN